MQKTALVNGPFANDGFDVNPRQHSFQRNFDFLVLGRHDGLDFEGFPIPFSGFV